MHARAARVRSEGYKMWGYGSTRDRCRMGSAAMIDGMRSRVEALCSDACAGRAAGSPGGVRARGLVTQWLAEAGLEPEVQAIPRVGGANLLARVPGSVDRWVLVAAHYDHVGVLGGQIYRGADDNAAAVAILLEVAAALHAHPPRGRGVLIAAFDAEEPPNFLSSTMGSQHFADHPTVPLETIDLMVCMDLVGHALGDRRLPAAVRDTVFALGAERSRGPAAHVDALATVADGVGVRRVDAETIPPLSDYHAFWERSVPFLFLSNGRSRHYHTPGDTPETLDFAKMAATARWLERFVRETCERPEPRIEWTGARDDASTARTLADIARALESVSPDAAAARAKAEAVLARCGPDGRLAERHRGELARLTMLMEQGLG